MLSAEGRASACARRGSAPLFRRRALEALPPKLTSGLRVAPWPALGALGVAALAALAMTAAGVDPIKPAAARGASPLGFLVAGMDSITGATTEDPAPADAMPAAPGRSRLVFSLSEALPQEDRRVTARGRALASDPVPPGNQWESAWQEAVVRLDQPIDGRVGDGTRQAPAELQPTPLPKPRKLVHTGTTDTLPSVVLKPQTWGSSANAVIGRFGAIGYDLDEVRESTRPVPRLFLEALPRDLADMSPVSAKKRLFFQSVLPIVLQVNEEIAAARWRVERLANRHMQADALAPADREWLIATADLYGADPLDVQDLLNRMDIVPPSLALAQAAEETGWGSSRFVREGNALFGQYTYNAKPGMVPARRDADRRHRVRSHGNLLAAVRAYVHNLNSHWAYEDFRRRRAELRHGGRLDGYALAGELRSYSERRSAYVKTIRQIIRQNRLGDFDRAWLNNRQWTAVISPPNRRPPI